ncbi:MerR family transcriptional regulator (plasmid) [Leptolyngbya boryana NIES-2135]|uniref:MerR family transcriptional regulator n=1 Tax=Leptolyngbya boryana NIES-2135 TaxID=1973484 RepID=A0A1Z4JRQ9_LEPBY|nr:heavy metal-responsive transcriptional regulator [Leptolyngbya boryana]ULP33243.1 heavy metal-responsive transcriptional regulator [Leptolyngbya boryana IU 594]BAY59412.1 MerR family transcriptional regulator [Leptolyngbya boryana NIES-2135]
MVHSQKAISQTPLFKIGEIAQQTGLAVATIRYYESLGLIQPKHRSESNYRYYDADAIERLQFIKKAQSLQFSLSEIQQILNVRQHGNPACPIVRELLDGKIAQLEAQIAQMLALKTELEQYRNRWAGKPLDDPHSRELCSLIAEVTALNSDE